MLLGKAKTEDAASYASGLLIGADVRIGLSIPTGAQITVMGRPELTRLYAAAIDDGQAATRSRSTARPASSREFRRSRKGSDVSASEAAATLPRPNAR